MANSVYSAPLVYLAGPITGLTVEEATDWREEVIKKLAFYGIVGLSPMRSKEHLLVERTTLKDSYEWHVLSSQKGITCRDHWDVMRCDVLLVNLLGASKVSIGSVMEIAWGHAYRKPIVVAMESGGLHDHAMIREVAGFILPTLEQAVETIISILSIKKPVTWQSV